MYITAIAKTVTRVWYNLYSTKLSDRLIGTTDIRNENIVEYTRTTHVDSGGMCV